MIERWITAHARTRMNHDDLLPRIHGRREGEAAALCGKSVAHRYGTRPFRPDDARVCPQCAAVDVGAGESLSPPSRAPQNAPLERAIKQSRRREAFGRQQPPGRGR